MLETSSIREFQGFIKRAVSCQNYLTIVSLRVSLWALLVLGLGGLALFELPCVGSYNKEENRDSD